MAKPPAFQLYVKDAYTGCAEMSGEEFGAYMRGLCWSWDNGPLPLDPARRARVMMVERADFDRVWEVVGPNWQQKPEGFTNARLEIQRAELEEYRLKCAEAGRKSGETRRSKRTDLPTDVHTDAITDVRTDLPTEEATEREQEGQPNTNSAVSCLQSSSSLPSATADRDAANAALPPVWREPVPRPTPIVQPRRNHAKCYDCPEACRRGICLPKFKGQQWEAQLADGQPEGYSAGGAVVTRLNAILADTPTGESMGDALNWWCDEWDRRYAKRKQQPATRPQPATYGDWFEECKAIHDPVCEKQMQHALRVANDVANFTERKASA